MALAAVALPVLQEELTVNGDFETGDATGWTYIETEISSFGVGNLNGDWIGDLYNERANSTAALRQENIGAGLVSPGDTIEVSFKAQGWDDEGDMPSPSSARRSAEAGAPHPRSWPGVTIQPGETWNFQFWYRDAGTVNLSDGLAICFQP